MWRYFMAQNTSRSIDVLDVLLRGYDYTVLSSMKMAPDEVSPMNTPKVFHNLYGPFSSRHAVKCLKFRKGDLVRISKIRGVFI